MTNEEAIRELEDRYLRISCYADKEACNKANEAIDIAIQAIEKQIQITNDKERIREAIMRLSMCARKECEICKYKDRPKDLLPSDDCKERITKNINLIADLLLITESDNDK